ncbi:MAG: hypothetical protein M4579_003892 [Chaenotheca gracillima]|nr:MAG: hypothetical protein M4579_003892 [Chaenotheca gracillima]
MTSALSSVSQSLSSLLRQTTLDDHDEVLRAANAALKKSKTDLEAQHVKVVALLKLDRYDDALRVLEDGGMKLKERAILERAYALYKTGHFGEAEEVAKSAPSGKGYRYVEAQATYRLENFPRAAQLYKDLSNQPFEVENEAADLRINLSATEAQMYWAAQGDLVQKRKLEREDLDAFETTFNAACACIARDELGQGEVLLKRARDLCSAVDDLSEDEKKAELLPILVQQIYVLARLGKNTDAEKLAAEFTVQEISEPSTQQVAQNNVLAVSSSPINPYLSHRQFHSTSSMPESSRPFRYQSRILRQNAYALDLLSLKYDGVARSTAKQSSEIPSPSVSPDQTVASAINAAAVVRNSVRKPALKEILQLLEKRPTDVGLLLTVIHLYVLTDNFQQATFVLEAFLHRLETSATQADQDARFAPGLVALAVSLNTTLGRKSTAKAELAKAASHWRHKSKTPPTSLLRAAGTALLDSTQDVDLSLAAELFTSLREQDPNDLQAIAGYVASKATTSNDDLSAELEKLTPVERLTADVDVAALENAGVPQPPSLAPSTQATKRGADDSSKPARKRFRKSRLPKDYDASKTADPERWLPVKDRSTYRPKGKKGKQRAAALTQGGVSSTGDNENLETAASAGVVKADKAGGVGGKAKNKKGKGKK